MMKALMGKQFCIILNMNRDIKISINFILISALTNTEKDTLTLSLGMMLLSSE